MTATPRLFRMPANLGIRHVVREGDSLWLIGRRHGVSVTDLARANGISPDRPILAGQRLRIPTGHIPPDAQEPPSPVEITLGRPPAAVEMGFIWPVAAPVKSPFGPRGRSWHGGIDIPAARGTSIRAAAPGVVIASGWEAGYGRVIKLWHGFEFVTVYAHNRENRVRPGDWVERGEVIGTVGNTGRSSAPHLHFEIRLAGHKYDPLFWLPAAGGVAVAGSAPQEMLSGP